MKKCGETQEIKDEQMGNVQRARNNSLLVKKLIEEKPL